jgi:hypothetical protein
MKRVKNIIKTSQETTQQEHIWWGKYKTDVLYSIATKTTSKAQ